MSTDLFIRRARISVGSFEVGNDRKQKPAGAEEAPVLRIAAKVEKDRKSEPNKAEVQIYNLSEHRRASIKKTDLLTIEAGYIGSIGQLFQGDVREISHVRSGADWITKITAGDGHKAYTTARVVESFAPGTKADKVIKRLVTAYGLKAGNADQMLQKKAAITEYLNGKTLVGPVHEQLERILADVGLEYSVQDGELQLIEIGKAVDAPAIRLDASSGLVGSPEFGESGEGAKKKVVLKAKSLLQHGIVPGRLVDLKSATRTALIRVDKVTHTFDTFAQTYYSDIEATVL